MFGFGKSNNQKKQLDELEKKYQNTSKILQNATARVENDSSLYKWQKQKQLKQIRRMECEQLVKYVDQKKKITNGK